MNMKICPECFGKMKTFDKNEGQVSYQCRKCKYVITRNEGNDRVKIAKKIGMFGVRRDGKRSNYTKGLI